MSDEHRYSEQEIAAIFGQAAEAQEEVRSSMADGEGLTLAELQQIGTEAGISPEFIARAAAEVVGRNPKAASRTYFGFPITVEHRVDLPGPLSDDGWNEIVADLRETFHASGTIGGSGSLREWRNGNLHVHVEPSATGHRLRFRTTKGSAGRALAGGSAFVAIGLLFLIVRLATGDLVLDSDSLFVGMLAAAGLAMIGLTRFTLPVWATERRRQMEAVAARAVEQMSARVEKPISEAGALPGIDLDALPDADERDPETGRGRIRA